MDVDAVRRARPSRRQAAVVTAGMANKGGAMLMATVLAVYVGREASPLAVSAIYTVYWLGVTLFAPVWGALADVTGRRRAVLVVLSVGATLGVAPLATVTGVASSLALRGVYAVFAAGFLPVMLAVVDGDSDGSGDRGRSMGLFNSAVAAGLLGGRFASGVVLSALDRTGVFLVVTAVVGSVAVAVAALGDASVDGSGGLLRPRPFLAEVRRRLLPTADQRRHLDVRGVRWLYVATFLRNVTVLGIGSLVPVYLLGVVGVSEFGMGVLLTVNPGLQIAFMYLFGHVTDERGRKPLVVGGLLLSGAYSVCIGLAGLPGTRLGRVAVAVVGFVLLSVGFSAMKTGSVAFIGDVAAIVREDGATERGSELQGLRQTARGLGGAVGPLAFGAAATVVGFVETFVAGSLLAVLAAGLVAWGVVETHVADGTAGASERPT